MTTMSATRTEVTLVRTAAPRKPGRGSGREAACASRASVQETEVFRRSRGPLPPLADVGPEVAVELARQLRTLEAGALGPPRDHELNPAGGVAQSDRLRPEDDR